MPSKVLVVHGVSEVQPGASAAALAGALCREGEVVRARLHRRKLRGEDGLLPVYTHEVVGAKGEVVAEVVDLPWADLSPAPQGLPAVVASWLGLLARLQRVLAREAVAGWAVGRAWALAAVVRAAVLVLTCAATGLYATFGLSLLLARAPWLGPALVLSVMVVALGVLMEEHRPADWWRHLVTLGAAVAFGAGLWPVAGLGDGGPWPLAPVLIAGLGGAGTAGLYAANSYPRREGGARWGSLLVGLLAMGAWQSLLGVLICQRLDLRDPPAVSALNTALAAETAIDLVWSLFPALLLVHALGGAAVPARERAAWAWNGLGTFLPPLVAHALTFLLLVGLHQTAGRQGPWPGPLAGEELALDWSRSPLWVLGHQDFDLFWSSSLWMLAGLVLHVSNVLPGIWRELRPGGALAPARAAAYAARQDHGRRAGAVAFYLGLLGVGLSYGAALVGSLLAGELDPGGGFGWLSALSADGGAEASPAAPLVLSLASGWLATFGLLLARSRLPVDLLQDALIFLDDERVRQAVGRRLRALHAQLRTGGEASPVLVVAHSQGSMFVLAEPQLRGADRLTCGSPRDELYRLLVPHLTEQLLPKVGLGTADRWWNISSPLDYVGRDLEGVANIRLVGGGVAHMGYFGSAEVGAWVRAWCEGGAAGLERSAAGQSPGHAEQRRPEQGAGQALVEGEQRQR